uniref:Glutaredoxin domain-containing protein n=1 Tax=Steinernema glaseri TaxID=37863 RepID=A0A1I7Z4P2_9BILA
MMRGVSLCFLVLLVLHVSDSRHTPTSPSSKERTSDNVPRDIDRDIASHKVMVFSKTYCPFSRALKTLLKNYKIKDMKVVELDLEENMHDMQDHLQTLSGIHTVPQLFVNGKFIGNFEETELKEETGQLKKILRAADAI